MKRKNEKVPEFDEITFENRNKEYGAYDLRKSYNTTASISILGGIAVCVLLVVAFSLSTEKGTATEPPVSVVITMTDPIIPDPVKPESKPPAPIANEIKNLAPIVTSDTTEIHSFIPTADDLVTSIINKDPNDTSNYQTPVEPLGPEVRDPFIVVEEMPQFPGGDAEMMKFISNNISYPEEAIRNNIQGRVILRFAVNTDGSIDRIQILRGIDNSLDSEAVRVVKTLPKFNPGKQRGVPVPVWFSLPVLFRLENN